MSRVFISHSHRDHPFAERLAHDLAIRGVDVWYELYSGQGLGSLHTWNEYRVGVSRATYQRQASVSQNSLISMES